MLKSINNKAYIAIFSVVAIGASCLFFLRGAAIIGLTNIELLTLYKNSSQAKVLAEGCWEEAARHLLIDFFQETATSTVTIGADTCSYSIKTKGNNRIINAEANYKGIIKRSYAELDWKNNKINIIERH